VVSGKLHSRILSSAHVEAETAAYRRLTFLQKSKRKYSHDGISVKTSFYWTGPTVKASVEFWKAWVFGSCWRTVDVNSFV
jgi:hypothetical protein